MSNNDKLKISQVLVDRQFLADCLEALNQVPNTQLGNHRSTYDLALRVQHYLNPNPEEMLSYYGWHVDDVKRIRRDLTEDQAMKVFLRIRAKRAGIAKMNYDVIERIAEEIFPT